LLNADQCARFLFTYWFTNSVTARRCQDGLFTALNDADEDKVRQEIGVYHNHIPKPSTDDTVVFSVPYNDTGGLGTGRHLAVTKQLTK